MVLEPIALASAPHGVRHLARTRTGTDGVDGTAARNVDLDDLRARRELILDIVARHGAANVRVFGSVVRGEDAPDSDVDLLVDVVGPTPPPWFPGSLIADLETALERKVDVVTEDSIYWLLRRRILKEAVPL